MINSPTQCRKIIYCHGLPGSSEELYFLNADDPMPERVFGSQHEDEIDSYFLSMPDQSVHVVGFSLGAMNAVKIAAEHEIVVGKLSLISAAAPLELGKFLPKMAGRLVFQSAIRGALQFRVLTALQKIGVDLSSDQTINMMFKDSPASENELLKDPDFKNALVSGLRQSYGINNSAYRQAILEYVQPWAHYLEKITCPVSIYHGVADNWAPIKMAIALKSKITSNVKVFEFAELDHYSTLIKALPLSIHN